MVMWSRFFFPEGSSSSSEGSMTQTTKSETTVMESLKCYVCGCYFTKPRILPCGHSFCEKCVLCVRESAVQEFNKSRDRNAHRRGDCGFFTCPWPECHYSMRIMNVSRWTLRNKALSTAVAAAKRHEKERETVETQTDIDSSSVLISLPGKFFNLAGNKSQPNGRVPNSPTATVVQHVLQNIVSTETIDVKHCHPPADTSDGTRSWRSYACLFGMAIFDQVMKMA